MRSREDDTRRNNNSEGGNNGLLEPEEEEEGHSFGDIGEEEDILDFQEQWEEVLDERMVENIAWCSVKVFELGGSSWFSLLGC